MIEIASNLIEVPVLGLQPGMYVSQLDRPWLETPFATQGFLIRDTADAEYVAQHCSYVYIDPKQAKVVDLNQKRFTRPDKISIKQEFTRAKVEFENASQAMEKVFAEIKSHRRLDIKAVRVAISPLIDSVFRNKDALAALTRLKDKGDYLFQHSLSTAVWSAVLGRHLGMERDELLELALGTSIMDVGMSTLPDNLLSKEGPLSTRELNLIQSHVGKSLSLAADGLSKRTLNILACHHERNDGSGYPHGLVGTQIPLFARIAGLVDAYDAMITQRPHAQARSSFEAVQELVDMKDTLFQGSLVEQFVQTVGMFPTGAIVELNTGEVGIVVRQNETRRLRPVVVLILNSEQQRRTDMPTIYFSKYTNTPTTWIVRELRAGAYGITPHDYFV
ncbi:MAG: DUF3391 domain-containing protein [Pseudomonadales bacterium]|nr:DUF3391 domain-containing protein [Pseudomonadales bacterium]